MSASPEDLVIDDDARKAIFALGDNFGAIGDLFVNGHGTPEGLRMCIAGLREAATVLEGVCDRWEGRRTRPRACKLCSDAGAETCLCGGV